MIISQSKLPSVSGILSPVCECAFLNKFFARYLRGLIAIPIQVLGGHAQHKKLSVKALFPSRVTTESCSVIPTS